MIRYIKNYIKNYIFSKRTKVEFRKKTDHIYSNKDLKYFIKSFGNQNQNKIFYVIQRSPGGGLFSNLNYVIYHLSICDKFNFIPIIDMKNFTTKYNSKKKFNNKSNAWEYYFSKVSKYSLKEVYKSKKVIITDSKTRGIDGFDSFENLDNTHEKIFKKYIKINKNILNKVDDFKKVYFRNHKILGVHFRGSDMKYQERHPFPPTINQIVNKINLLLKKHIIKNFLVTEEENYLQKLKLIFKNKLIFYNSYRSNNMTSLKILEQIMS